MTIKTIIVEEIQKFKEGIADRYAEKEFNIPDPNAEMDKIATAGIKTLDNGKAIGKIFNKKKRIDSTVFLNPPNLTNFDENVRAITDEQGNLFVAQRDQDFYHDDLGEVINSTGKFVVYNVYNVDNYDKVILWHRIGRSNTFGFSISYIQYAVIPEHHPTIVRLLNNIKRKNPNFTFIPQEWTKVKKNQIK